MKKLTFCVAACFIGMPVPSLAATSSGDVSRCNTKSAASTEEADLPGLLNDEDQPEEAAPQIAAGDPSLAANGATDSRRDWSIDLGKELDSLAPISGPNFADSPVLLLRLENLPKFDSRRNCNRVFPVLGKPQIERLADGTIRATLDKYKIEFPATKPPGPWKADDKDKTGRVYWIFPRLFGGGVTSPWQLTAAYQIAFQKAKPGSIRRSWLAESYFDLAMRTYWDKALSKRFPRDVPPFRIVLDRRVIDRIGIDCSIQSTDLFCLTAKLIELNENGTPAKRLSQTAFRTSDAVYESSGLTVGLQQLDVAVDGEAKLRLPQWMPKTVGRNNHYRKKIRLWTVDDLNRWYSTDAPVANDELADPAIRDKIIDSFVSRMIDRRNHWEKLVQDVYPLGDAWTDEQRKTVALMAIDVENVAGYSLYLPPDAKNACNVFTSSYRRPKSSRDNATFLYHAEISRRFRNARNILSALPAFSTVDLSCIQTP
jgi:hypothetical protein